MKSFLLAIGFVCFVGKTHGQQLYAELEVEANKINDLQAFAAGDSLFLTYSDRNTRKSFWIDASGRTHPVFFPNIEGLRFLAVERHHDTTYFYYFKKEDSFLKLYSLKQTSGSGGIYTGGGHVNFFEGRLMGICQEADSIIALSYLKKSNRIEIISVRRGVKTAMVDLQMPDDFSKYAASTGFISNREMLPIPQATAPTKIYKEGSSIILAIDEDRFEIGKSKTRVIKVNLVTGERSEHVLPGPDYDKFTSFYHQDYLFRLTTSNDKFQWFVFDLQSGETLYTKILRQEKPLRGQKVFFRTNESMEVRHIPMYGMIAQNTDAAIMIETTDSPTDLRIVTGTYDNSKGVAGAAAMTPLGYLAGLIVFNVINQLEGPPGLTTYFYLKGNAQDGFEFEPVENNPSPSLRQVIDDYEISRTSGVPRNEEKWSWFLTYKGYLEFNGGALGIYQENRKKDKKLILMKFDKR